jgi:hypothetical protein
MASAANSLQAAIFTVLNGDATLLGLLGGARIHDRAPTDVAFPYITFGRTSIYDWSTATERGTEQLFTLNVWSKGRGKKEALAIMERVETLLHDQPQTLAGHRLVNCRLESSDVRFEDDHDIQRGMMRFRAVTEPS